MPALHQAIKRLARFFDDKGQHDKPIDVRSSRRYVRQEFKAKVRGGPLFVGEHEIRLSRNPTATVDIDDQAVISFDEATP